MRCCWLHAGKRGVRAWRRAFAARLMNHSEFIGHADNTAWGTCDPTAWRKKQGWPDPDSEDLGAPLDLLTVADVAAMLRVSR